MWVNMTDKAVVSDLQARGAGKTFRHRIYHWQLRRMLMGIVRRARLLPSGAAELRRLDGACSYLLAYLSHDQICPMRQIRRELRSLLVDDRYVRDMALFGRSTSPLLAGAPMLRR